MVTYVDSAGMNGVSVGAAASIPAGVLDNDLIVLVASMNTQGFPDLVPAGSGADFNAAVAQGWNHWLPRASGNDVNMHGYWRYADAAQDAGTTIQMAHSDGSTGGKAAGAIIVFRDAVGLGGIELWTGGHAVATATHPNPTTDVPSINAPTIAVSYCSSKSGTFTLDPEIALVKPAAMTFRAGAVNGGGGGIATVVATEDAPTNGTYAGGDWTAEDTTTHAVAVSFHIVPGDPLQPPPETTGRVKVMRGGVWTGDGEVVVL